MVLQQRVSEGPSRSRTSSDLNNFQMEKEDVMIVMIPPSSKVNKCIATDNDKQLVYVIVRVQSLTASNEQLKC